MRFRHKVMLKTHSSCLELDEESNCDIDPSYQLASLGRPVGELKKLFLTYAAGAVAKVGLWR